MPQAIMLQDHETLGERGTVVDVSKGYLRNYLIPRKLAEPATKGSIAAAQRRQQVAERALAEATTKARDNAELLNKTVLTITHQAGDDGRLFGSVTTQDIVDAIREARGIKLDKRKVHLDEPDDLDVRRAGRRLVPDRTFEGGLAAQLVVRWHLPPHVLGQAVENHVMVAGSQAGDVSLDDVLLGARGASTSLRRPSS